MILISIIKHNIEKYSQRYLWASIFLASLFFIFLACRRYYYFDYNIADLAIFNQTFYNTLHGHWFDNTITLNNYLADHFSLAILFLLPIYAIKQTALTLLVIQVIITFLSAWPIYLISKKLSNSNFFSYLVALCWLLNPFVHRAALYEFHILHLATFLFFWVFYFYLTGKFKFYLFFILLTLLCREDLALLLFGFFMLSIFDHKKFKWILWSAIIPLVYFFVAFFIIKKISPSGDFKYLTYYQWLGGETMSQILWQWITHPLQVVVHIFAPTNLFYLLVLFLPFLMLPILSPKYLLLSFLPIMMFVLAESGLRAIHLNIHYVFLFLPGTFVAFIFSLSKILNRDKFICSKFIYDNFIFFKIIFFFSLVYFLLTYSPIFYLLRKKYPPDYHQRRQEIIDLLPPHASVVADSSLLAPLSSRAQVYNVNYAYFGKSQFALRGFVLPEVDYIYLDMSQFMTILLESKTSTILWSSTDPLLMPDTWMVKLKEYDLVIAENEIFLWKLKKLGIEDSLPFYKIYENAEKNESPLDSWRVSGNKNGKTLAIKYNQLPGNNYLLRFYKNDYYWEIPFDYGLYSKKLLDNNQSLEVYYYLDNQVNFFELYNYKGGNGLSYMGEAVPNIERNLVWKKTGI
jgi:uncharacterized membrane protein